MRHPGFYWVKYDGDWTIVHYYGSEHTYPWELSRIDSDFEEIDERRIEREPTVDEKNAPNDIYPQTKEEIEQYIKEAIKNVNELFNKKKNE